MAVKDPLTGLYNRRYLDSHLRSLLERSAASEEPVSLLMFDIDLFKAVNDIHGHASGDAVLVEFAERLKDGVRGTNLVARFGGEEFIVQIHTSPAGVIYGLSNLGRLWAYGNQLDGSGPEAGIPEKNIGWHLIAERELEA